MITVEIFNFQNVKHLRMDLRGFCTLVGQSNIGKSSVVRAISCVAENPPANSFIRKGTREAKVAITFHDQKKYVEWRRHLDDGASYIIADLDEAGKQVNPQKLSRFGRSVPEPIQKMKFLRLFTDQWTSGIGFAPQHRYFFLLDNSKLLIDLAGELQDLAALNRALKLAQTTRRKAQEEIRFQDRVIAKLGTEAGAYVGTEGWSQDVEVVQGLVTDAISKRAKFATFSELGKRFVAHNVSLSGVESILGRLETVDLDTTPCEGLVADTTRVRAATSDLTGFGSEYKQVTSEIERIDGILEKVPDIQIDEGKIRELRDLQSLRVRLSSAMGQYAALRPVLSFEVPDVPDLSTALHDLSELQAICDRKVKAENEIVSTDSLLLAANRQLEMAEEEFRNLKEEHPHCPLCGSDWSRHE